MPGLRLPELFHLGWVVRDCEAAEEELRERLGAGPSSIPWVYLEGGAARGTVIELLERSEVSLALFRPVLELVRR